MSYDSLGNITNSTGTLDAGRFLYAGYLWNASVNQYATHSRWYALDSRRAVRRKWDDFVIRF